jgi:hypothetical protein
MNRSSWTNVRWTKVGRKSVDERSTNRSRIEVHGRTSNEQKSDESPTDGNLTTVGRCNNDGDVATRNATMQQWPCCSSAAMVELAARRWWSSLCGGSLVELVVCDVGEACCARCWWSLLRAALAELAARGVRGACCNVATAHCCSWQRSNTAVACNAATLRNVRCSSRRGRRCLAAL